MFVGGFMKSDINKILEKYIDVYSYVSVKEYMESRSSLLKEDIFNDYSKIKDYKTIITLGMAYPSKTLSNKDKKIGLLSKYSYGTDYHIVFRQKLAFIEEDLHQLGIATYGTVDTGEIDERWAGYLAHMGFLGKSQFLITKEYGSYVYLATILIDKDINKEFSIQDTCGTCDLCVKACPTNALDGRFIKERCISELTQSKKELDDTEISSIRNLVYGCDICQQVCPKNKGIDSHIHPEFEASGIEKVDLINVLQLSNREYKKIYGNNASSWKGATIIKRNTLCLLANRGVTESIPIIKETIDKYHDILWYNNVALKVLKKLERKI